MVFQLHRAGEVWVFLYMESAWIGQLNRKLIYSIYFKN